MDESDNNGTTFDDDHVAFSFGSNSEWEITVSRIEEEAFCEQSIENGFS